MEAKVEELGSSSRDGSLTQPIPIGGMEVEGASSFFVKSAVKMVTMHGIVLGLHGVISVEKRLRPPRGVNR
jgi:hypothetical protein